MLARFRAGSRPKKRVPFPRVTRVPFWKHMIIAATLPTEVDVGCTSATARGRRVSADHDDTGDQKRGDTSRCACSDRYKDAQCDTKTDGRDGESNDPPRLAMRTASRATKTTAFVLLTAPAGAGVIAFDLFHAPSVPHRERAPLPRARFRASTGYPYPGRRICQWVLELR